MAKKKNQNRNLNEGDEVVLVSDKDFIFATRTWHSKRSQRAEPGEHTKSNTVKLGINMKGKILRIPDKNFAVVEINKVAYLLKQEVLQKKK